MRFKNGQGSNLDGGNYRVHENGSLEIERTRQEDQGIYTCVATNILGKAENQVRLEVKGKGEGCGVERLCPLEPPHYMDSPLGQHPRPVTQVLRGREPPPPHTHTEPRKLWGSDSRRD